MPELKRSGMWGPVPNGSVLKVAVKGTTKTSGVTALAEVETLSDLDGTRQTTRVGLDTVAGKPLEIVIASPNNVSVMLDVALLSDGNAVVSGEVFDPQGNLIPPVVGGQLKRPPDKAEVFFFFVMSEALSLHSGTAGNTGSSAVAKKASRGSSPKKKSRGGKRSGRGRHK